MPLASSLDSLQDNPIGSLSGIFGAPQTPQWVDGPGKVQSKGKAKVAKVNVARSEVTAASLDAAA